MKIDELMREWLTEQVEHYDAGNASAFTRRTGAVIPQQNLSEMIRGKRTVGVQHVDAVATALGLSSSDVLGALFKAAVAAEARGRDHDGVRPSIKPRRPAK